jgi:ribosomal protein S18 acetylase RimI-like enzyme
LMTALKERLSTAGVSTFDLDVVATNEAAIRFYQRHGLRLGVTRMMGRLDGEAWS